MSSQLKISLIQTNVIWENPEANRIQLEKKIANITTTDVIVLPEMFTSGFTMKASRVAETIHGNTIQWLQHIANTYDTAVCGSLVIEENGNYFNRFVFVVPNGDISTYNKRHTFTLAKEHKVYKAGKKKVIIDYKGWRICPQICYDLRFPVWSRNCDAYDVLIYVASWPAARINAWDTLLKARAIENMSYCIGVNRVGLDANGYKYPGHSAAYDVLGERLDTIPKHEEAIATVTLKKFSIKKYREQLNFLNDSDRFSIEI